MDTRRHHSFPPLWVVSLLLGFYFPQKAWPFGKIVTLPTRPKVEIRFLLEKAKHPSKGIFILFVGSDGTRAFKQGPSGKVKLGQNFLARVSPEFVKRGYTVVLPAVPSDLKSGYTNRFRQSVSHLKDILKITQSIDKKSQKKIHLFGISRGTLSSAYLASQFNQTKFSQFKSLVLFSSLPKNLKALELKNISLPTLFVHHRKDPCRVSPFDKARKLPKWFTSARTTDFFEVTGGKLKTPRKCASRGPHGFEGKETEVVDAVLKWIESNTR